MSEAEEVESVLEELRGRLPSLPELPRFTPSELDESRRRLLDLVRDSGRELKRLRREPRARTAPLASFRQACRSALRAMRGLAKESDRLEAARRRLGERSR